jgi:hypothetical protein
MLIDPATQKRITTIPHLSAYRAWCSKLSSGELQAIKEELNARIDGSDIHTSSWMPGADWTGTVFDPILHESMLYERGRGGQDVRIGSLGCNAEPR